MPRPRVESWKNLEENPWKMSILEYLGEFQWFWAVLEESLLPWDLTLNYNS